MRRASGPQGVDGPWGAGGGFELGGDVEAAEVAEAFADHLDADRQTVGGAVGHDCCGQTEEVRRDHRAEGVADERLGSVRVGVEFLAALVELTKPSLIVEIGTFTGYSALSMATALERVDPGGDARIICCDISEEWTSIGRAHWERAGVAHRIDLRIAPAIETLRTLPDSPTIDLAFIDADKGGYSEYYDEVLR